MKSILIAAGVIGVAAAVLILYMQHQVLNSDINYTEDPDLGIAPTR